MRELKRRPTSKEKRSQPLKRIFVSGKVGNESAAKALMTSLREAGFEVTFDWTVIPHLKPYEAREAESASAAVLELKGVEEADVLVVLEDSRGAGMYVEIGAALALRKPVIAVISGPVRSMFLLHPLVTRLSSEQEVIKHLQSLANS